ncbi:MAG: mechanosensitive ion channel protein MscS [Gemmatimonadaceae bacterium]|jgi:miniconductance mechanosensitive channel|nr:mechanosensitive ion channel protein MscS [Gemmatimonadaceae bacterium]
MTHLLELFHAWSADQPAAWMILRTLALLLAAWVGFLVARTVLLRWVAHLIRSSRTRLDDAMLEHGVLRRMALLAPVVIIYYGIEAIPGPTQYLLQIVNAALAIVFLLVAGAGINALQEALTEYDARSDVPIKSYAQIVKIVIYVVGGLMTIAVLTGQSPWALLSGVGALMAVIILVFRDTILSLVASFTIASNRLVKVGDWIEAPGFGADGDVIDIALHTVKVQNWDKTITTIPTYKLVETSFKNWRGMQDSGGRRIKRAIHLDMNTVRFCDEEMLGRFEKFELIAGYVRSRRQEVEADNSQRQADLSELVNGRRLTNVGTFRAYVAAYLHSHPDIHEDMTFLVRQLAPTPKGLPLEIYVFTTTTAWGEYESIQSDIFDHLLAVAPQFDLRVFQEPAGSDWRSGAYAGS